MSRTSKFAAFFLAWVIATPVWAQENSAQEIMDKDLSQALAQEEAARAELKKTLADIAARAASAKPPTLNSAITALTAGDRSALQADRLFLSKTLKAYGAYTLGQAPFTISGPQVAKEVYTDLWDDSGLYGTQVVRLSVISKAEANAAFRALKYQDPAVPSFGLLPVGATQAIVIEFESKGVLAGAVVLHGKFYIKVDSGLAMYEEIVRPVVLVREGDSAVPYVMDLDHNDAPVPIGQWLAAIRGAPNTQTNEIFLESRYDLSANSRRESASAYTADFVDGVNFALRLNCKSRERELRPRQDGDYKKVCAKRSAE